MTAYSRSQSKEIQGLSWVLELSSVNRKTLDLNFYLSKELLFLEMDLRKLISELVKRGQVTIRLHVKHSQEGSVPLPLLKKLKGQWEELSEKLGYDPKAIDLSFLLEQAGKVSIEESLGPKIQKEIKATVKRGLDAFIEMKEVEGKALASDIKKRLKTLVSKLSVIEKQVAQRPEKYREKLLEKLSDLLQNAREDERLLKEVALFAEKIDITEEIVRLRSHFQQMESLLESSEISIGRTLDFLTQEMLREVNTIASKSQALEVTKKAVEAKAELEKIREQVQNIE